MAEATGGAAPVTDDLEKASCDAHDALTAMKQILDDVAGSAMSMSEAKDAALRSINALTEAAQAEDASLDGADEASIRFRDSIRDVESAHRDSGEAILANGGTLQEARAEWLADRDAVIEMLGAKGLDIDQAKAWADQNLGSSAEVSAALVGVKDAVNSIPDAKNIMIGLSGAAVAIADIQRVNAELKSLPQYKDISVGVNGGVSGLTNGGFFSGGVKAFASGGFEPGIYPYSPGGIHKFAEEHSEAYISLDPARRRRSEAVWVRTGQEMGMFSGGGGSAASSRNEVTVNHHNTFADRDPRLAGRQLGREAERAFSSM